MLLKKLTEASGLSSQENEVRNIIIEEIKDFVDEYKIDRMGSVIVTKKSKKGGGIHVALSAHMDEVGLVVTQIDEAGLIKFHPIGCEAKILPSKVVKVGSKGAKGVIGAKPIHLQRPDERNNVLSINDLYIDIGSKSKGETEALVSRGDFVVFDSDYVEFGENDRLIKSKALDNRAGCAALIELIKSEADCVNDLTFIFTVQEEVGIRGAALTSKAVTPDVYINVESTLCADVPDAKEHDTVNILGNGPSVSLMDSGTIYLKKYTASFIETAKQNGIPYQYRRSKMSITDASRYTTAQSGFPVIGVAVPCRYIHSPVSVIAKDDYNNLVKLLGVYINSDLKKTGLFD